MIFLTAFIVGVVVAQFSLRTPNGPPLPIKERCPASISPGTVKTLIRITTAKDGVRMHFTRPSRPIPSGNRLADDGVDKLQECGRRLAAVAREVEQWTLDGDLAAELGMYVSTMLARCERDLAFATVEVTR